jgi:hypothetical protein
LPKLRGHGVRNSRSAGGYLIPIHDADAPRSC